MLSGTHILAYGSLIFITTVFAFIYFNTIRIKGGSLVLRLIISGLILHSWLFIETHFKEFALNTLELKNFFAVKMFFLIYLF